MCTTLELQGKTREELATVVASLQQNFQKASQQFKEELSTQQETLVTQKEIITQQKTRIKTQDKSIAQLIEQIRLQRHQRFASKSEKYDEDHPQNLLFDEAVPPDNQAEIEAVDDEITVASFRRKKKNKCGRKALPENLPREQKIYDLPDAEKVCHCGCRLTHIGDEKSEQLNIIPAKVYVIQHVRKKYACKGCEETIKQAALPKQPIPRSIASPGLLAHILVSKFEDYLPLYRQERILQRIGVDIARATLSHWVIKSAELLEPLYKLLQANIQEYDVAFADETTMQVLNEPGRAAQTKSYLWAFGGGPPDKFAYLYHYSPSRGNEVVANFLEGFTGYLHSDGYQAYDVFARQRDIKQVACWYHSRRKFVEADKISGKDGLAKEAIRFIKKLSKIEKEATLQKLTPQQVYHKRQRHAQPILKAFKAWLDENIVKAPPKSLIGKALSYTMNQWPKLLTYIEGGRLEISNNSTERAIKPFVIGRKNWMFSHSVDGAKAGAIILSMIETCKAHNIQPYDYLARILIELPTCETQEQLEALLPFNINNHESA